MNSWQFFKEANHRFWNHWGSYISIVFWTTMLIGAVAVPVFTWLTSWILRMGNIPYVSYTNAIEIITGSPWVALGLLAELLALVVVIYWQFAFILLSIVNIRQEKPRTLWAVLRKTILSLQGTSPVTFLFFLGYFIIIVPFGGLLLSSPLLNKVKIPDFIWQFLLQNPVATVAIVTFYVLVGYLGIRLLLTLPLMIIQQVRTVPAIRLSWRKTHGRVWFYIGNIVLIVGTKALITMLVYLLAYFSQLYLDTTKLAFAGAMVNLFLMELISEFMNYYMSTLVFGLMISGANDFRQLRAASLLQFSRPKVRHWQRWVTGTALVFLTASMVAFNAVVLNGHALSKPMAISHRGVDNGNGVQNTIPALRKTAKENPDYVEMDIHETKDHQFVVMHDENLDDLSGIDKEPHQLTLKQLTRITVRENGHKAKIASFDQYLKVAHQIHQKLLVEIKVTPYDTPNMTSLFIQRYQRTLLKHHDRIHTLSYPVVQQLKSQAPDLFVSYILPYNLTFPETKANAYTMEATTLNDSFISNANQRHQQVYAWTVDDIDQMDQMMFLGVDGIITDQLHELQVEIKDNTDHPSYANLLLALMSELGADSKN